jgi:hypothetical protein
MAEMPIAQLTRGKPPNVCVGPDLATIKITRPSQTQEIVRPTQKGKIDTLTGGFFTGF